MRTTPSTSQNSSDGAELLLDQAGEQHRHDEEQADGQRQRGDDRQRPGALADRLLVLGGLRVGAHLERLEADRERLAERDDAADHRPAQRAAAAHPRDDGMRLDGDLAVLAGRHRPGGDAAHHHALEDGLAAHGGVALLRAAHISVIGSPERS